MKPTVYLDATIPSFYHEDRPDTIIQAWREITVQFWEHARHEYSLVISHEVLRELQDLGYPAAKREKCLNLVKGLPLLAMTEEVTDLAEFYIQESVMPSYDVGDSYHLAFATWYRIQYLVTWNCRHLANANKFQHIQVVNARKRLASPLLVTPAQLLEIDI